MSVITHSFTQVQLVADPSGAFIRMLGLELGVGMEGPKCQRFAGIIDDGVLLKVVSLWPCPTPCKASRGSLHYPLSHSVFSLCYSQSQPVSHTHPALVKPHKALGLCYPKWLKMPKAARITLTLSEAQLGPHASRRALLSQKLIAAMRTNMTPKNNN